MLLLALAATFSLGCAGQTSPASPDVLPPPPPPMRTETLGRSVEGRPITLYRFGEGPVRTLVIGGVHGDEPTAIYLAERLVEWLREEARAGRGSVAVIPVANPDAAAARKRTNARGVDVNRNFPAANWKETRRGASYTGPSPGSEPETAALRDAVLSLAPRQIISIHSITRGRECNNYDGPAAELAERMSAHNGYPVRASIGYPTPGSFGSWAGIDLGIPVVTLELPRDLPGPEAWERNRAALIKAVEE